MRPLTGIFAVLAMLVPASALPQQPPTRDTMTALLEPPPLQLRRATVVALMVDSLLLPTTPQFAAARAVAESLGFAFTTALIGERAFVDSRYQAVYYLPRDVRTGYFILIPGHRPDVVRGEVEPDSLRRRLIRYRELAGPLVVR